MADNNTMKRLNAELIGLKSSIASLTYATDDIEGHLYWANACRHFKQALQISTNIGMADPHRRGQAHKARNTASKDGILSYVVASRNHIDHPEDEGKDDILGGTHKGSKFSVGNGLIEIGAGWSFDFTNVQIEDREMNGRISVSDDGNTVTLSGQVSGTFEMGGFYPSAIMTMSKEVIAAPLDQKTHRPLSGIEILRYAFTWLRIQVEILAPGVSPNSLSWPTDTAKNHKTPKIHYIM